MRFRRSVVTEWWTEVDLDRPRVFRLFYRITRNSLGGYQAFRVLRNYDGVTTTESVGPLTDRLKDARSDCVRDLGRIDAGTIEP